MKSVAQTLKGVGWISVKSLRAMTVATVVLTGACTTPSTYLDSIKKFQTSAVATSTTARTYLLDLNRFERNTYLDSLRAEGLVATVKPGTPRQLANGKLLEG